VMRRAVLAITVLPFLNRPAMCLVIYIPNYQRD
jgi:hypothetical protein